MLTEPRRVSAGLRAEQCIAIPWLQQCSDWLDGSAAAATIESQNPPLTSHCHPAGRDAAGPACDWVQDVFGRFHARRTPPTPARCRGHAVGVGAAGRRSGARAAGPRPRGAASKRAERCAAARCWQRSTCGWHITGSGCPTAGGQPPIFAARAASTASRSHRRHRRRVADQHRDGRTAGRDPAVACAAAAPAARVWRQHLEQRRGGSIPCGHADFAAARSGGIDPPARLALGLASGLEDSLADLAVCGSEAADLQFLESSFLPFRQPQATAALTQPAAAVGRA